METLKTLSEIVNDYKGEAVNVTADTTFEELGFDSLDKVDLMMQVEEKFGVTLGDDVAVATVGELAAKIDELK
ncbi:MAG: acyl carrier protein [Clostridia bacterium]|jgi:acyl carrier protein|uniref:acyl carrier protein n=1 Tax=Pumilibacter muris TaxID=2941510 RepID=UPI0023B9E9F9|nr:phosphopantetheine-binding protein [Pumilibacter muris]MCI8596225.1 acyl carrier protein [Clostridia bacterium]